MIRTLSELARQVRAGTLQLLHVPDPAWLTWAPPGTSNHILWHAGHALWVQDVLCIAPLTGTSELPRGWAEAFGQDCRPPLATSKWPEEAEVRERLETQLARVLDLLMDTSDTIVVNADEIFPGSGWPLFPGMVHAWHDEARHQGEMYLLHKMRRSASSLSPK